MKRLLLFALLCVGVGTADSQAPLPYGFGTVGAAYPSNPQPSNTSADGFVLLDSTAASAGNQQFSPRIRLSGQGWETNTTASQAVDWIIENQPVQGAANPTSSVMFSSQVNGGGYTASIAIGAGGVINSPNSAVVLSSGGTQEMFIGSNVDVYSARIRMANGIIESTSSGITVASGTGACATTSTIHGGQMAGDFKCTGTTGASTVTLTMYTNAPLTGYVCYGRDVTTPTTLTQTGAISTTSVTFTMTSVTANDVIQWGCPISY